MPFAHGPVLAYVGRGRYRTVGSTEYVGATDRITIPDGFETDLASVPRLFWALLPPQGAYERAAVLHDYLCVQLAARQWPRGSDGRILYVTSRHTDGLFRRVMREAGVGFVTRWVMWCGVRWGALANPARRAGWWRDAPAVLAITAGVLVVALGASWGLHEGIAATLTLLTGQEAP